MSHDTTSRHFRQQVAVRMARMCQTLNFSLALLGLLVVVQHATASVRQAVEQQHGHFYMRQNVEANLGRKLVKRSLRHHLSKRDAEDDTCKNQETILEERRKLHSGFLVTNKFVNESKYSIAIAWVGENTGKLLVVTTEEVLIFTKPSTVYQSKNDGKTFDIINDRVNGAQIHKDNGLQKDPHNPTKVFLVAYSSDHSLNSVLWITQDGGDTFSRVQLPFPLTGALTFYPDRTHPDLLLVKTNSKQLYLSKDGGMSWKSILEQVVLFKWGTGSAGNKTTLYASVNKRGDPHQNTLMKSVDLGVTWVTILDGIHTFGSQGKFLYVSVMVPNGYSERIMEVSTDEGKRWNQVQLPSITEDRFYSILDMTEGMIFMHVDSPSDNGQGTLYTSDSSGILFSESLRHHLYPNYLDLTDFYKVESIRGVYLASQIDEDQSIHTMITFDRGASWQPVRRPEGVMCKDESKPCSLQIHSAYSRSRGITSQPPLSIKNAVGLIVVHGHVADALQTTPPDVFVSSDGGYTWTKSLDGPHTIQIADHGGLLVAIPSIPNPKVLKYSTDEGRCWHTVNFTEEDLMITGLLTEPGNRAMSVSVWGFGNKDRIWRVHVLNFSKIIDRQCDKTKDYVEWVAHGDNTDDPRFRGCLLGTNETFKRLKKDSLCANGYSYEVITKKAICPCRVDDFDCDYGYERKKNAEGNDICVEDPKFNKGQLDICRFGHEEELITKGYRKVPGDKCRGGFYPEGDKIVSLNALCQMGSKELLIKEIELGKKTHSHTATSAIWAAVVIIVLLLAFVFVVYFTKKYNLLRRGSGTYAYSSLTQNEDGLEEALLNNSLYDETTDEVANAPLEFASSQNNYSTMKAGDAGISSSDTQTTPVNGFQVQPHLKSYHDDSDVDMLD